METTPSLASSFTTSGQQQRQPEKMICAICSLALVFVFHAPGPCDHHFCSGCIGDWLRRNKDICPKCHVPFFVRPSASSLSTNVAPPKSVKITDDEMLSRELRSLSLIQQPMTIQYPPNAIPTNVTIPRAILSTNFSNESSENRLMTLQNRQPPFSGSTIINDQMKITLRHWLPCDQWRMIFKASRGGFGAQDFHRTCDKKGATITVIKDINGNIFGGTVSHFSHYHHRLLLFFSSSYYPRPLFSRLFVFLFFSFHQVLLLSLGRVLPLLRGDQIHKHSYFRYVT
jgi:hypothetical protein